MAKKITITEEQLKRLISTNTINERRHTYSPTEGDETYAEEEEKDEVEEEVWPGQGCHETSYEEDEEDFDPDYSIHS